jgi:hypothetical protein
MRNMRAKIVMIKKPVTAESTHRKKICGDFTSIAEHVCVKKPMLHVSL